MPTVEELANQLNALVPVLGGEVGYRSFIQRLVAAGVPAGTIQATIASASPGEVFEKLEALPGTTEEQRASEREGQVQAGVFGSPADTAVLEEERATGQVIVPQSFAQPGTATGTTAERIARFEDESGLIFVDQLQDGTLIFSDGVNQGEYVDTGRAIVQKGLVGGDAFDPAVVDSILGNPSLSDTAKIAALIDAGFSPTLAADAVSGRLSTSGGTGTGRTLFPEELRQIQLQNELLQRDLSDPNLTSFVDERSGDTVFVDREGNEVGRQPFGFASIDPERSFAFDADRFLNLPREQITAENQRALLNANTRGFESINQLAPQLGNLALANAGFTRDVLREPADFLARAFLQRGGESPLPVVSQADIINQLRSNIQGFNDVLGGFSPQPVTFGGFDDALANPQLFPPAPAQTFAAPPPAQPAPQQTFDLDAFLAANPHIGFGRGPTRPVPQQAAAQPAPTRSFVAGSPRDPRVGAGDPRFGGFAQGGFTREPVFRVGEPVRGQPNEETVINPTNAPIAVVARPVDEIPGFQRGTRYPGFQSGTIVEELFRLNALPPEERSAQVGFRTDRVGNVIDPGPGARSGGGTTNPPPPASTATAPQPNPATSVTQTAAALPPVSGVRATGGATNPPPSATAAPAPQPTPTFAGVAGLGGEGVDTPAERARAAQLAGDPFDQRILDDFNRLSQQLALGDQIRSFAATDDIGGLSNLFLQQGLIDTPLQGAAGGATGQPPAGSQIPQLPTPDQVTQPQLQELALANAPPGALSVAQGRPPQPLSFAFPQGFSLPTRRQLLQLTPDEFDSLRTLYAAFNINLDDILFEVERRFTGPTTQRARFVPGFSQGTIAPEKARKILSDGTVRGKPITKAQRGFFGVRASGR